MGPEAAVLSGKWAQGGAWRSYANLEYPQEGALYVEVSARQAAVSRMYRDRRQRWHGMREKLRLFFRGRREVEGVRSVVAIPVATYPARAPRTDAGASLSALPIFALDRGEVGAAERRTGLPVAGVPLRPRLGH